MAFAAAEEPAPAAVTFEGAADNLPPAAVRRDRHIRRPRTRVTTPVPHAEPVVIGSKTLRQVSDSELAEFLVHHSYNITLPDTWYPAYAPNTWTVRPTSMGSKVLRKGGPQEVYVRCFFVSYNGPIDTLPEEERQFAHQYVDIFVSANTFSHARDLNLRAVLKPLLRDAQGVAQLLSSLVPSARQETTADTVSQGAQTEPMFPQRQDTVYAQQSISWGEPRVAPADLRSIFHQRFAHVNERILTEIGRQHGELHIPKKYVHSAVSQGPKVKCSCCMQNKATVGRTFPLGDPRHKADRFLSRVCMDFSGQIQIPGYNGARYFCVFVDEATDFTWIYLAKSLAEAPDILRRFFIDAHSMTDHKVVILRTDNAGEFHSPEFQGILQGYHVKMECCCPYSHYQNGKAERMIRDVSEKAHCMMNHAQCPRDFWTWAVQVVTRSGFVTASLWKAKPSGHPMNWCMVTSLISPCCASLAAPLLLPKIVILPGYKTPSGTAAAFPASSLASPQMAMTWPAALPSRDTSYGLSKPVLA
jgi:hypothetical protein